MRLKSHSIAITKLGGLKPSELCNFNSRVELKLHPFEIT